MAASSLSIILKLSGAGQVTAGLGAVASKLEATGSVLQRTLGTGMKIAAGIGAAGVGTLAVGFAAAARSGLGFNNAVEQASGRINAFTKDGAKTAEILEMVRTRAALTPFAFNEMANAAAGLLPVMRATGEGLESLMETAEVLAASNPAEGLEGAAFALKEAAGGDFASVIERFNLSRTTLNRLKDEGVPALEAVRIAMQEMGYDTDLVANMAVTAEGRWSTLKDTFTTLAGVVTQPIFDMFSAGLGTLQGKLDEHMPRLQEFAALLGEKIAGGVSALADFLLPKLATGFQLVRDFVVTFRDAMAGEWVNDEKIQPIHRLAGALGNAVAAFQEGGLNAAIATFLDTLRNTNPNFGLLLDALVTFKQAWSGEWVDSNMVHPFHRVVGVIGSALPIAIATMVTFWEDTLLPAIQNQETFVQLRDVLTAIAVVIMAAVIPSIIATITAAAPLVIAIVGLTLFVAALRNAWERDWGGIRTKTEEAWAAMKPVMGEIEVSMSKTLAGAMADLRAKWGAGWDSIKNAITGAKEALNELWGVLSGFVAWVSTLVIANPFSGWTMPSFSLPGGTGAPHRAHGGAVQAGQAYVVGDGGGPEMFVPRESGYVHSSEDSSALFGGSIYVTVNVGRGSDGYAIGLETGEGLLEALRSRGRRP